MFRFRGLLAASVLGAVSLSVPQAARADMITDFMMLDQSYCTGNGGTYGGMTCSGGGARRPKPLSDAQKRILRRGRRQDRAFADAQDATLRLIDSIPAIVERLGPLPPPPELPQDKAFNVMCMRAGLSSLLLLQQEPELFKEVASLKSGIESGERTRIVDGVHYARRHIQMVYLHAARLLLDRYYFEARHLLQLEALIQSQLGPALLQFGALSTFVGLDGTGESSVDMFGNSNDIFRWALRVGFFSAESDAKYIFSSRACLGGKMMTISESIPLKDATGRLFWKIAEATPQRYELGNRELHDFDITKIYPSALDFRLEDFERGRQLGAENYAGYTRHDGPIPPWRAELIRQVHDARPGCATSRAISCPSMKDAGAIVSMLLGRTMIQQIRNDRPQCESETGRHCPVAFEQASVEDAWEKIERWKRMAGHSLEPSAAALTVPETATAPAAATPWIGIDIANYIDVPHRVPAWEQVYGVVVTGVVPGSPAEAAGLRENDLIYHMHDRYVNNRPELAALVGSLAPSDVVPVAIFRDGEALGVNIRIGARQ